MPLHPTPPISHLKAILYDYFLEGFWSHDTDNKELASAQASSHIVRLSNEQSVTLDTVELQLDGYTALILEARRYAQSYYEITYNCRDGAVDEELATEEIRRLIRNVIDFDLCG